MEGGGGFGERWERGERGTEIVSGGSVRSQVSKQQTRGARQN